MKILPSYAFLARTLYLQFSRCVTPSSTGCFKWLNVIVDGFISKSHLYFRTRRESFQLPIAPGMRPTNEVS
jgi:hypothetical protein